MLERMYRINERMEAHEAVLVEVVVGGDGCRRVLDWMVEIPVGHLGRQIELKPLRLRKPQQCVRVSTVPSFGDPSTTTFGCSVLAAYPLEPESSASHRRG